MRRGLYDTCDHRGSKPSTTRKTSLKEKREKKCQLYNTNKDLDLFYSRGKN